MNFKSILSAVVSAVLAAILGYIVTKTDIYVLNGKEILNIAVMTACVSLLKVIGTTPSGNFAGVVPVK